MRQEPVRKITDVDDGAQSPIQVREIIYSNNKAKQQTPSSWDFRPTTSSATA